MEWTDPDPLLDAIPLPAIIIGGDERIDSVNKSAQALLGAGLAGRHFATVLRQPRMLAAIETALRTAEPAEGRYALSGGAREVTYAVHARPFGAGPRSGLLVTLIDTSAERMVGQMRRDFVANVSHELKTPLTALLGFIETLKGAARDDPKARARFLGIMEAEAARMNRLVGDLLSLSQVEEDERVRPTGTVDLALILNTVREALTPLAEARGVTLDLQVPTPGPVVSGDRDLLQQVFANLIENGIKYGDADRDVRIIVHPATRDPILRKPAIRIDVADRGDGIDPLHLPRLTERFYRVDTHRSRELGGTGLGLAIVKHILNRHRGRLIIDSQPGQGSTFSVVLPAE